MLNKYLIAGVLLIVVIVGAYHHGYTEAEETAALEYARQLSEIRKSELRLSAEIEQLEQDYLKEKLDYEERIDGYIDNVRTRTVRVRIKPDQTSVSENDATTCGDDATDGTYVDPRIVEYVIRLAERGDRAIQRLGLCQSYVKKNYAVINKNEE